MTRIAAKGSPAPTARSLDGAERAAHAERAQPTGSATHRLSQADHFEPRPRTEGVDPGQATRGGGPGALVQAMTQHRAQGRAAVVLELDSARAKLDTAVQALPALASRATALALDTSCHRVLQALDAGRITVPEAQDAAHMLSEMVGALLAIEQGQFELKEVAIGDQPDIQAYDVKTTSGDVIRVVARRQGSARGQARLKLYNTADDGQRVDKPHRVMVRFDLEGSEKDGSELKPAIDVQIGHDKPGPGKLRLDTRVHGVQLDRRGQPLSNRLGNPVANHHFDQALSPELSKRQGFADFVSAFLDRLEDSHEGET